MKTARTVSLIDRITMTRRELESLAAEAKGVERGGCLAVNSGVIQITSFPDLVSALVQSSQGNDLPYIVTITKEEDTWCTCPNVRLGLCKHAIAVFLTIAALREGKLPQDKQDRIKRVVKYNDMVRDLKGMYPVELLEPDKKHRGIPLVHIYWATEFLTIEEHAAWSAEVEGKPDRYPPSFSEPPQPRESSRSGSLMQHLRHLIDY